MLYIRAVTILDLFKFPVKYNFLIIEPEDPCVALAKLEAEIYCRTRERNRETCDCSREASAAATASTAPKIDKTEQENANNANGTANAADDQKNEAGGPKDPCKYQCSSDGGQVRSTYLRQHFSLP